ncbi:hypothetical protein [Mesorhizobium sp. M1252]|uniref:hypothetical protein n=1 Tax=Mesorhizobium sp. M1252 TaxID=2957073 RepID=UPI00333B5158
MVATVGSISIDLSTNANKFADGFKRNAATVETQSARMAKAVSAVERNVAGMAGTLKTFGTGLAAGVGLAALASLGGAFDKLKQTISEYDEIAANAKTTGLRTDTYQALAFAAKQANIDQESYNSSLNIFAKNAGLAALGQGALFSSLKKLNPELLQNILNTKDQEERLKLVADAMAQTSDATEKAALSAAVFGKGGVEMARIFEQGRASIDKFKKTALELGIIIPDDLLQRAGELDDKLDVLSTVINANLGKALIRLAPLLTGATEAFSGFSQELAHFSEQLANFKTNPTFENFLTLVRGDAKVGLLDKIAEGAKTAAAAFGRSADDINADIASVQQQIAELQQMSDRGIGVGIQIDDAKANLQHLQDELKVTQAVGVTAANTIAGQFAQAFRIAENASMDALAKMNAELSAGSTTSLPTVHRYGGDPNQIDLPSRSSTYNSNANGSGVGVRSFGGDPNLKATADYTEDTADNVDRLDTNTKGYISRLSDDIGRYSAQQTQQQNIVINKLSDVTAQTFGMLSSSILAALVHNNDSGATGTGNTMFGDAFDPSVGSYISSWGIGHTQLGSYKLASTADDGSSNTSVNVQQPGTNITLNYTAAAGESEGTARQRARQMFDELTLQASRE